MNENLRKMAEATPEVAADIIQLLERKALDLELHNDPSIWFSFIINTLCMCLGAELECELQQKTYGMLLDEMNQPLHDTIVDHAKKISKFGFEEIVSKRHPGAIRIVVDPEKKS